MKRHSFRMVFGHSPETMWKLHLSAKFPQHAIRWNYGILSSVYKSSKFPNSSIHITFILNFQIKHCAKHWSFPLKISSVNGFQICSFMRIWSHLLKESLMENFIFCEVKKYLWWNIYVRCKRVCILVVWRIAQEYSEHCQTSKMERFAKIENKF